MKKRGRGMFSIKRKGRGKGKLYPGWQWRFYTNTVYCTVHTHQKYNTISYIFRKKIPYIPYILLYLYRTDTKKIINFRKNCALRKPQKKFFS